MRFNDAVRKLEREMVERENADLLLVSTKKDLEDFQGSRVWQDIRTFCSFLVVQTRDELEQMGKANGVTLEDVAYNQGICFATRRLMDLTELLTERLDMPTEEESDGEEEE